MRSGRELWSTEWCKLHSYRRHLHSLQSLISVMRDSVKKQYDDAFFAALIIGRIGRLEALLQGSLFAS